MPDRSAAIVAEALAAKIRRLPLELRRSLTWDRGSNENTNGLLRQYFPKGTDLAQHSQRHLDAVARQMNQRPRKTPGFKDPAEVMAEVLR